MELYNKAYNDLISNFWSEEQGVCKQHSKHFILPKKVDRDEEGVYSYWWHAHELDYLVDVYLRTKSKETLQLINSTIVNNIRLNGNTIKNDFYDDMLWNALAIERLYRETRDIEHKAYLMTLWEDIKLGYNEWCGGGVAWRKDMLWYKNTPANCPAIILASRMYNLNGKEEDLRFAKNVFDWQIENLFDHETGYVIDGMNRENDMKKDIDWKFTYCQGVFIGACLEMSKQFGNKAYLKYANMTIDNLDKMFLDENNILIDEGADDIGLFKGILARYLAEYHIATGCEKSLNVVQANYLQLENIAKEQSGLFSRDFYKLKSEVELPEYLSAAILIEAYQNILNK